MDPVTPAILVMLACNPDGQMCREMQSPASYASIEACRAALPEMLHKMKRLGRPVIGRCEADQAIDPTVTGTVQSDVAIVRVTRGDNGRMNTSIYRVRKTVR